MSGLDEWNAQLRGERGEAQRVAAEEALVEFLVQVILDSIKISNHAAIRIMQDRGGGGCNVVVSL